MSFGLALAWFSVGFFVASFCWWVGIKVHGRKRRRVVKGYYGSINVPYSVVGKVMQEDLNRQIRESLYTGSTIIKSKSGWPGSHGYNLWHIKDDDEDY